MNDEKKPEGEIVLQGRFAKWFENYWYHYKWVTIGVAAAVIVLLVCILQTCSRKQEDLMMTYAGPTVLSVSEQEQLSAAMAAVMPYDLDDNGEEYVAFRTYHILSKEQILEREAQMDENGDAGYVDRSYNSEQYNTYSSYLKTGETSIYFLDPWLYAELRDADRLVPLSEAVGEIPESAVDEYGVRLGDTALYAKYRVLRQLPEDTVICLMHPHVIGKSSDEKSYRLEQEMFRALVTYSDEE